jgi:hypothetical protein
MLINGTYLPVSIFLVFVLSNDHISAVAKPMIIDLNPVKIKGSKAV